MPNAQRLVPQDLNLLLPLEALLEERHITRAAERAALTQPAMSRALGRLRAVFSDELLIRDHGHYELTVLGRDLLDQVRVLLPAVRAMFVGDSFVPETAVTQFRLAGTDYPVAVLGPSLVRAIRRDAPHCTLAFEPWSHSLTEQLSSGAVDAMLVAVAPPNGLRSERVLDETMVCVVDEKNGRAGSHELDLDHYLGLHHLAVATEGRDQATVDGTLAALGLRRRVTVSVPTHLSALALIPGTDVIATLPARLVGPDATELGLRVIAAPPALRTISVTLVWHPRADQHQAQQWLRQQIRDAARSQSIIFREPHP